MNIPITEVGQASEERGASPAPLLSAVQREKVQLAAFGKPPQEKLALALKKTSTELLNDKLAGQFVEEEGTALAAFQISAELTARGVAPCFRGLSSVIRMLFFA
jgi:hypothetical protein